MNKAVLNSLTEKEAVLVREADPAAIKELDEDELLELHGRVQRARTKYVTIYRRGASASVAGVGTRRPATRTTGGLKRDASSQAQGARRQAARDAG